MDYLVYVSHDAENLQFWLWIQDYTKRFYASSKSDQALSQPWYDVENTQPNGTASEQHPRTADKSKMDVIEYEANFENAENSVSPIMSPHFDKQSFISSTANSNRTIADSVDDVNAQMGLRWQSCKIYFAKFCLMGRAFTNVHQSQSSHLDLKSIV